MPQERSATGEERFEPVARNWSGSFWHRERLCAIVPPSAVTVAVGWPQEAVLLPATGIIQRARHRGATPKRGKPRLTLNSAATAFRHGLLGAAHLNQRLQQHVWRVICSAPARLADRHHQHCQHPRRERQFGGWLEPGANAGAAPFRAVRPAVENGGAPARAGGASEGRQRRRNPLAGNCPHVRPGNAAADRISASQPHARRRSLPNALTRGLRPC